MKTKIFYAIILLLSLSFGSFSFSFAGEPVPGAEILVEQEPNDVPIASAVTNKDGEFSFTFPSGIKIPKNGIFKITIMPPKHLKKSVAKKLTGMEKQTIEIPFKKKDGPKFKFVITWEQKTKSNRGGFAVSGRNNA
jgi:hypothetical protein